MSNSLRAVVQAVSTAIGDLETGTATGGTATTLVDMSDDSPFTGGDGAGLFAEDWVHVHTGTNAGAERRVSSYTPGSRQLTFADAWASPIDATSQYEIRRLTRRSPVVAAVNRALTRRLYSATVEPIGLLADGDGAMQDADTAKWTGTNATLTKESTENDFISVGRRSLRLDALAGGAYAESQAILVKPGESLRVVAVVLPYVVGSAKSTASLVVRDQDNAADVALGGTTTASYAVDGARWKWLDTTVAVPTGCGRITLRLTEGTNGARCFWGFVTAVRPDDRYYVAPAWCDGPEALEWVWMHEDMDPNQPYQRRLRKVAAQTYFHERPGEGFPLLEVPGAPGRVLFVSGSRYYDELAADADTTNAPLPWLLAASVVELLEPLVRTVDERDKVRLAQTLAEARLQLNRAAGDAEPDVVVPLRLSGR